MSDEDLLEGHCEKCGIKNQIHQREKDFVPIGADGIGGTNTRKKLTKSVLYACM